MHTPLCGHAVGEPEDYVDAAVEAGIDWITFTCHVPIEPESVFRGPGIRMGMAEYPRYREMIGRARVYGETRGVDVRVGIEAEVFPEESLLRDMREFVAGEDFDFVLGSLHHQLPGFGDWIEENGLDTDAAIIGAYFDVLARGAESGFYDSLAHPDLIRIYGTVEPFDPREYADVIESFLDRVAETGVCLEVNTSGFIKGVFEMHPDPSILKMAAERGIGLTIGSDSHRPEQVGQCFERAYENLVSAGYDRVHAFRGRERFAVPLEASPGLTRLGNPNPL